MNKAIEVVVAPTGEIQIDAVGFKGPDCEQATRFLEEALGTVSQRKRKPEYLSRGLSRMLQKVGR